MNGNVIDLNSPDQNQNYNSISPSEKLEYDPYDNNFSKNKINLSKSNINKNYSQDRFFNDQSNKKKFGNHNYKNNWHPNRFNNEEQFSKKIDNYIQNKLVDNDSIKNGAHKNVEETDIQK
jgi:hypothetical protein